VSKDINKMIEATEKNITELRKREQEQANAILSLSKVLGKTGKGDFTARVDTKGWSEELATIGMAINTLIETLEFEKKEEK
jgi:methyl-accepting chemotaxis protein